MRHRLRQSYDTSTSLRTAFLLNLSFTLVEIIGEVKRTSLCFIEEAAEGEGQRQWQVGRGEAS